MVGNANAFFAQRLPCVDDFRGARISGSLHEFTGGLVRCRANDGGHAGLEDSALLPCNRRERFTKVLNVIYVYAHYASRERLNHVGTVQQAAKAHLHHGNIHLLTREALKSECGGYLEERGIQVRDERLVLVQEAHYIVGRNCPAVHNNALAKVHQVGRRVGANLESAPLERAREHRHHAPLPVGTSNVQYGNRKVRVAYRCEKCSSALQPRPHRASGTAEECVQRLTITRPGQVVVQADSRPADAACPVMWRSSLPTVDFKSRRCTTASSIPLSSRNSAVWNPSGRSCPIVCLITRGPANPITAPGSARIASPSMAKLALTPPVVGLVSIEMYGMLRSSS